MDFVVVGFGLGALAVLLGLGLRDLGPWFWRIAPWRELPSPLLVRRVACARGCRAGGLVLALAGGAVLLITLIILFAGTKDRTGLLLVAGTITLAAGGTLAWLFAYLRFAHPDLLSSRRRVAAPVVAPDLAPAPETPEPVAPPWVPAAPTYLATTTNGTQVDEPPPTPSPPPFVGPDQTVTVPDGFDVVPLDLAFDAAPAKVAPTPDEEQPTEAEREPIVVDADAAPESTAPAEPRPEPEAAPAPPTGNAAEPDPDPDPNPASTAPPPILANGREALPSDEDATDRTEPLVIGRAPADGN